MRLTEPEIVGFDDCAYCEREEQNLCEEVERLKQALERAEWLGRGCGFVLHAML